MLTPRTAISALVWDTLFNFYHNTISPKGRKASEKKSDAFVFLKSWGGEPLVLFALISG